MIRWIYNLCFPLVFVLLLPGYLRRMARRGNFRKNFGQRFGWYSPEVRARLTRGTPGMWIQAVSVGEMLVALKLVDALRARRPDIALILSTTTTTGYQLAEARAGANVEVLYTPVDSWGSVRRAFDALRPSLVVIVDGGLWPNLLWEAERRGVPTALVNARLSHRSESRFRRLHLLAAPLFRRLKLVCVTEPEDKARWENLGVPSERLIHTGSVKFDDQHHSVTPRTGALHAKLAALLRTLDIDEDQPILLAGSTHPGEERILAEIFQQLRAQFPRLFLILVPRHVERSTQIQAELIALNLRVALRTATEVSAAHLTQAQPEVLLVDTTGELGEWYAFATVVFIGKSLTGVGGQNPVEAITLGKPVILGPHMENFQELVSRLLKTNATIQIQTPAELHDACARLLADPLERSRLAEVAMRTISVHHGAACRTAVILLDPASFSACKTV